jgi:hypothetical protein
MIAYAASQRAVRGLSFSHEMDLLDKCISVLSYCALKDALAGRFRDLLNRQLTDLQKHHIPGSESSTGSPIEESSLDDLFNFDPGSSPLHSATRNLLSLIHRPFNGLGEISTSATLFNRAETTMGTHLEWEWELKENKNAENMMDWDGACGTGDASGITEKPSFPQSQEGAWTTWTPTKNPLL